MEKRYNLNRIVYFVATVEEGSITAAADRLGVSKAVVSKQLQQLEQEVEVSLLTRNTRHLQLTEAGRLFHERSSVALVQANEAFEATLSRSTVPSGQLRITAPVDYGIGHVASMVARFRERYPRVIVELDLGDERTDVVQQRYDLAFRIGWLKDSSNRARKLRSFREIAVCTPATLARQSIEVPKDLATLPFIANGALDGEAQWTFQQGKKRRSVTMQTAMTMNITLAIREALLTGGGFAIFPDVLVQKDIEAGRLVRLLPHWTLREGGIYAVTPPGRLRSSAVRTFLDMVQNEPPAL